MEDSSLMVLAGASLFFGFLFGFNLGMKYEIEMKVTYHARPEILITNEKSNDTIEKLVKVL